jgi:hypothetical protein
MGKKRCGMGGRRKAPAFINVKNLSISLNDSRGVAPIIAVILLLLGVGVIFTTWIFFAELFFATLLILFGIFILYTGFTLAKNRIIGQKIFAFLLIASLTMVMFGVLASPISPFAIVPSDFSTKTKSFEHVGFAGFGPDSQNGEVSDSIRYITGKVSEKVVMAGTFKKVGVSLAAIAQYQFDVFFTTGVSWGEKVESFGPFSIPFSISTEYNTEPFIFTLPASAGFVRIQLLGLVEDPIGNPIKTWKLFAQDDAYVKQGVGSVQFLADRYEVSQVARAEYTLGWATSSKITGPSTQGWTITIFSGAQGKIVKTESVPGNKDITKGIIEYKVVPEDFKLTTFCGEASSLNFLRVEVFNNLVQNDNDDATTIDVAELGPGKPTIALDKRTYKVGDSLTVSLAAEPNPETNLPVCGLRLKIFYKDPVSTLVDTDLKEGQNTYTIGALPDKGVIVVESWSFDAAGRPSEISVAEVRVFGENDFIAGEIPVMVIVLFVIWSLVGLLLVALRRKLPLPSAALVLILLIGYALIVLGFAMGILFITSIGRPRKPRRWRSWRKR